MKRRALFALELVLLTALVCASRCANWHDVFVDGQIYFSDADCYARMTRARICYEHPGTIVRHHEFENFPVGTTPHTTAPFDYAIVTLAMCLRPFSANGLEIAGAFISPLIAVIGGWFLWWWMRRMQFRWRIAGLLLYAISPIIVHATELGRPDHQSLALVLVLVAACADWSVRTQPARTWSVVAGAAWGFGLWVSAYEPLVLFAVAAAGSIGTKFVRSRWIVFTAVIAVALLIEHHAFVMPQIWRDQRIANWLSTIGEMRPVPLLSATWLEWCGLFAVAALVLIPYGFRRGTSPPTLIVLLLLVSFAATLLQARWGYFFAGLFALILPSLIASIRMKFAAIALVVTGFVPVLHAWDASLWPNESTLATRTQRRSEMRDLCAAAAATITSGSTAFIAPWWLSPAIAYWSGNNGVAGSSHESIEGTRDTARFYATTNTAEAHEILVGRNVQWVIAYDSERTAQSSAAIVGSNVVPGCLAFTLRRTPSRAPRFLDAVYQNGTCTVFSVHNSP